MKRPVKIEIRNKGKEGNDEGKNKESQKDNPEDSQQPGKGRQWQQQRTRWKPEAKTILQEKNDIRQGEKD